MTLLKILLSGLGVVVAGYFVIMVVCWLADDYPPDDLR